MIIPDAEITRIANSILGSRLGAYGFANSKVVSSVDFEGTPFVQLEAHYEGKPIEDVKKVIETVDVLRSDLFKRGEERIILVTNVYSLENTEEDDEDEVDDGGEAPK